MPPVTDWDMFPWEVVDGELQPKVLPAPVEAEDGSVRFTTQMTVTLSCDHRVLDGAVGAKLLQQFKAIVETPILFLV